MNSSNFRNSKFYRRAFIIQNSTCHLFAIKTLLIIRGRNNSHSFIFSLLQIAIKSINGLPYLFIFFWKKVIFQMLFSLNFNQLILLFYHSTFIRFTPSKKTRSLADVIHLCVKINKY
jgi:hypothetical protein